MTGCSLMWSPVGLSGSLWPPLQSSGHFTVTSSKAKNAAKVFSEDISLQMVANSCCKRSKVHSSSGSWTRNFRGQDVHETPASEAITLLNLFYRLITTYFVFMIFKQYKCYKRNTEWIYWSEIYWKFTEKSLLSMTLIEWRVMQKHQFPQEQSDWCLLINCAWNRRQIIF